MITARTALLLALREGPGYGRELIRRLRRATGGRLSFAEGSTYPALRRLAIARLVRRWTVVPGRRRGHRARFYYELTERGARASEKERADLLRMATGEAPRLVDGEERARMERRIELGAELSESASEVSVVANDRRRRSAWR